MRKTKVATHPKVEQVEQAAPQVEQVVETAKKPRLGIGKWVQDKMLKEPALTNTQLLGLVKEQFPSAGTSMACIAWYRTDLRTKGLIAQRVLKKNQPAQQVAA